MPQQTPNTATAKAQQDSSSGQKAPVASPARDNRASQRAKHKPQLTSFSALETGQSQIPHGGPWAHAELESPWASPPGCQPPQDVVASRDGHPAYVDHPLWQDPLASQSTLLADTCPAPLAVTREPGKAAVGLSSSLAGKHKLGALGIPDSVPIRTCAQWGCQGHLGRTGSFSDRPGRLSTRADQTWCGPHYSCLTQREEARAAPCPLLYVPKMNAPAAHSLQT